MKIATVFTIDFDWFIIKSRLWKRNPKIIIDFILNDVDKIRIVEAHLDPARYVIIGKKLRKIKVAMIIWYWALSGRITAVTAE